MSFPLDLVFQQAPISGPPTPLVFGEVEGPTILPRFIDVAVELGGIEVSAFLVPSVDVDVAVDLGGITVSAVGRYDNRVTRWLQSITDSAFQEAQAAKVIVDGAWVTSLPKKTSTDAGWGLATQVGLDARIGHQTAKPERQSVQENWMLAISAGVQSESGHQTGIPIKHYYLADWQTARMVAHSRSSGYQTGVRKARTLNNSDWQLARTFRPTFRSVFKPSKFTSGVQSSDAPWQSSRHAPSGISPWPPLAPPVHLPATAHLVFMCPPLVGLPLNLVFGSEPCYSVGPLAPFYILPARFYMTTHNLIAHLLPDMAEVPLYDCKLGADKGSFAWQFSASGPASLMEQLAPSFGIPKQLQITLDGMVWVFAVNSRKRDERFAKNRVNIAGRSVTTQIGGALARDMAFNNASAATAQQLALQALDLSGIGLDWDIDDWLVPAGAWSFSGTRLAAVQAIAEAAGGYLQSHRSEPTLQVRHPYPARPTGESGGPWNWGLGAADIELAPDAIIIGGIEDKEGADINGVYVSGTTHGVLALVKRTGTAGEKLAPMQTNALITAIQAAEQRGLAILGKAGPQYDVSLELPILTGIDQPGVIDVGKLVQINVSTPWRGRVSSVSVSGDMPTARQIITLERHI